LFRAVAVLRVVVTVNAVALNVYRYDNYDHPRAGTVVVLAMVVWTGFALWAYADARRRTALLLGLDLALAVAALVATPVVKGTDFNATIPGFWVMVPMMAWAIHWHVRGGLVAATLTSVADFAVRDDFSQTNYANVFLLMIGGPIVGYLCGSLKRMAAERDAAERAAAAADERARLARAVHDGVLQVLALVQRRGGELGGQGAELARLAGDQERSLRSLIRQQDTAVSPTSGERDLVRGLEQLVTAHPCRVELATPGGAVSLPATVADGLVAVVSACLDNVCAHVGDGATAWVLVEAHPDSVTVSVRDDGPGIPEGRLTAAEAEGRLGVASSIRGRMEELGGTADLDTGPHGTEWELTVPIPFPT
jgi:signal transduction histidine kinase